MSTWDTAFVKEDASEKKSEEKIDFTKFPEGITKIRVVGIEPHVRWTHWMPQFGRSLNCPGRGCQVCTIIKNGKAAGTKVPYNTQKRFAIGILNLSNGKAEICDQGVGFFEDLRELREENFTEYGEMANYDIKVKRRGLKQDDTKYKIDFLDDRELTSEEKMEIEKLPLLSEYFKPHTPQQIARLLAGEDWITVVTSTEEEE